MPVPQSIVELVERFERNERAYRSAAYNERDVRTEFIDPLFQALGWDVHNVSGWAEPYKDVVREHSLRIEGRLSAPDYSFRIGGTRKFFVEAKKPAVNIKAEREPAFQLRRYAWSAKLPLSILTDFEELAVYDCRVKPERNARASTARVMYMTYREYLHRWDEIEAVFSRDAVLRGSFDSYAQDTRGKRGTAEVDAAFLGDMQTWRRSLAVAFAAKNRTLTETELNYAVQQTIDRIVFLRISEDRGIEPYGRLGELTSGSDVYRRLQVFFNRADKRYNSGLFHFRQERGRSEEPDVLTPSLQLPDKPLKDIIRGLYYPESPYEFSVVPPDILGQVYEQFLGQVIRLTARHQARVEDKPEVRRAGGVYYTPTHVVNYIVQHTLGEASRSKDRSPSRQYSYRRSSMWIGIVPARSVRVPSGLAPARVHRQRLADL